MSLERYRSSRVIVLNAHTTVYEAVRAMESNHVGVIMVQDRGRLVGIVTDRDIALRVIGYELNPEETELVDVMTPAPATISLEAAEDEALALMRDRHVRRLPITSEQRVVGMLSLDDLILSQNVPPRALADIVRAQLAEPAPLKPAGATRPERPSEMTPGEEPSLSEERHRMHADQTYREFLHRLRDATGADTEERALTAFEVVASAIVRRVTATEGGDFLSQLPYVIRERLLELPAGPDRSVDRQSIEAEMARRLDIDRGTAADLVQRVGAAMSQFVSIGELDDIDAQLPTELKGLVRPHA